MRFRAAPSRPCRNCRGCGTRTSRACSSYGSRALGRQRPASDIDLTLRGAEISSSTLAQIEAELDDLLLPWMIDLSRLADLSHPPLLDHIARVGQVLYGRELG